MSSPIAARPKLQRRNTPAERGVKVEQSRARQSGDRSGASAARISGVRIWFRRAISVPLELKRF